LQIFDFGISEFCDWQKQGLFKAKEITKSVNFEISNLKQWQ